MISELEPLPPAVQHQLAELLAELQQHLGANLIGVYLHGSLAMGCFNPALSDIDLLVRVRDQLTPDTRQRTIKMLLELSGQPSPIEISLLSDDDLSPWHHPTPYSLHFGEDWRERFQSDLAYPQYKDSPVDPDLAAHITLLHARGVTLLGPPPADVFSAVPPEDYLDSILGDYRWARDRINEAPVYGVLNMLRVLRYLTDGAICSKKEAGTWARQVLPPDVVPVVEAALARYRGERDRVEIDSDELQRFVDEVDIMITRAPG